MQSDYQQRRYLAIVASRSGINGTTMRYVASVGGCVLHVLFFILVSNKKKPTFFPVVFCSNPHIRHTFFPLPANQDFTFSKKLCHLWGGGFIWHLKCLGCCFCLFCLSWVVRKHYPDRLFCCCFFMIESGSLKPVLGGQKNKYNFEPIGMAGVRAPKPIKVLWWTKECYSICRSPTQSQCLL